MDDLDVFYMENVWTSPKHLTVFTAKLEVQWKSTCIFLHNVFFFSKIVLNGCCFKTTRLLSNDGPIWHFYPYVQPCCSLKRTPIWHFQAHPYVQCSCSIISGLQFCFFNPSLCAVHLCRFARSNLALSAPEKPKLECAKRDLRLDSPLVPFRLKKRNWKVNGWKCKFSGRFFPGKAPDVNKYFRDFFYAKFNFVWILMKIDLNTLN